MLHFNVKGKQGRYSLNLPTSIKEIDETYIKKVTDHVIVAPNYSLIGTIFREKLSTIILSSRRNNKKSDIAVIPIFIKSGNESDDFIKNIKIKDKIIISPSDIMLGHHVSTPNNVLSINNILDIIDGDTEIYQKSLTTTEYCYFIEFKLVPNCNIHGAYNNNSNEFINNFITKVTIE